MTQGVVDTQNVHNVQRTEERQRDVTSCLFLLAPIALLIALFASV